MDWIVSELIDDNTKRWDMEKITRFSPPREAYEVFKLPLPTNNRPDTVIWEPEKNGLFSVQSAYRLLLASSDERQLGEVSYGEEQSRMWRKIWKLHVPNIVRIFAWRVCQNNLPTLKNLQEKKMLTDARCRWCNMENEDINHALLYCPRLQDVLFSLLTFLKENAVRTNFIHIVETIIRRNKTGELEKLFLCAWGIWYSRNQLIFENKWICLEQAVDHALLVAKEYECVVAKLKIGSKPHCGWIHPPVGSLKLNVDGVLFHDQGRSSVGMILRDENGKVLFIASKPEHEIFDPMEVEFMALLRGLQLCLPLGIHDLQVESDALLVVQELTKGEESMSIWRSLVLEIRNLLLRFPNVVIQYRGRMANSAANCLAKYSWHLHHLMVWWNSFPTVVSHIIEHDAL